MDLLYSPTVTLLSAYSREMGTYVTHRILHYVPSSFVCKNHTLETTQMSLNAQWMNEKTNFGTSRK